MRYVSKATLERAIRELYGSAGHLLKIWLTLKHMGLAVGREPIEVDTSNSAPALKRLFGCGASDGRLFVPFAHTPRYLTMKHDASRSIVQTNIQRWATSGSVVTCDPTEYLEINIDERGKLTVGTARRYPIGLGIGESGFALEEGARVQVPWNAFAVWYGRQTMIPEGVDAKAHLGNLLSTDLSLSPAEKSVVFVEDDFEVKTGSVKMSDSEVFGCCAPFINGEKEPQVRISKENFDVYARRVKGMVSNLELPSWMRASPAEAVQALIKEQCKAILLFGPPRTGKTRIIDQLVPRDDSSRCTIQIHDGWGYDNLIEGFKPNAEGKWNWVDGRLKEAIDQKKKYIVLEEVNRTHISQAMGEVFSLIEDSYRGEANGLILRSGRKFWIPENCIFFLTMNTIDKSTEDVDDAFMGRIAAVECPPRPEDLREMLAGKKIPDTISDRLAQLFAEILNVYPLGHGYFAGLHGDVTREDVLRYYKSRVRPVLYNFLGELKRAELQKVDNVVDEFFGHT